MQVSEISVMRRRNLGNYEHKEVTVKIALEEGDSEKEALSKADSLVAESLEIKTKTVAQVKTSTNVKAKEEPKKNEETKSQSKVETAAKPSSAGKKKTKKKTTETKVSKNDVLVALRGYAKAKNSREMAQAVLEDVTGAKSLDEVDAKDYGKLVRALKV